MKNPTSRPAPFVMLAALCALVFVHAAFAGEPRDSRKKLVMLVAEAEYETAKTLPEFASAFLQKEFRVVVVSGSTAPGENAFDRVDEVSSADVLLVSSRRRTPPAAQLEVIRRYVAAGKPVVGIRTASHALARVKGKNLAAGEAEWPEFDAQVIGGNYVGHHGTGPTTTVTAANAGHPLLRGVKVPFTSVSTLYKVNPLRTGAQALLTGAIPGQPAEPVAWTFARADGGRTFYTSLGSPTDFKNPAFTRLLHNALRWAAGLPDSGR
ncbi:MAG: ThuA domain-containing protein [Verrucomicrobia bacterium]|nr:ThuA domain-containing protein [Verrucomicrobiota bacterium]